METDLRVARLAALADPTRLRIADHLHGGDVSPSELAAALDVSSNLLAHHLAALERAGVVTRHRSHADRRRTYLHLEQTALLGLLPDGTAPRRRPSRVVFVCTANSARSQLAAALWPLASDLPVVSAGTRPSRGVAEGAIAAARRHRLDLTGAVPQPLDGVLRDGDLVVTVCDAAHEELGEIHRRAAGVRLAQLRHWSLPDPVADGSQRAFDATVSDLAERIAHLAAQLDEPSS